MISYEIYKIMHLLGVFMVLAALFGWTINYINGGHKDTPARKILMISHGVGLLFVLVAGFGLLARIHQSALQSWVLLKFCIWLIFGVYTMFLHKKILPPKAHWFIILALAMTAVVLVQLKI